MNNPEERILSIKVTQKTISLLGMQAEKAGLTISAYCRVLLAEAIEAAKQ